jgi:hypothetical protein
MYAGNDVAIITFRTHVGVGNDSTLASDLASWDMLTANSAAIYNMRPRIDREGRGEGSSFMNRALAVGFSGAAPQGSS